MDLMSRTDDMALQDVIPCPYNESHSVKPSQFRYHLMECKDYSARPRAASVNVNRRSQPQLNNHYKEQFSTVPLMEVYTNSKDPDRLLECPYDKNHQVRACRFPYHLIKCRKNHPDVVRQLVTCPFNARHQVPRGDLIHHLASCDDKCCIEQDVVNEAVSPKRWETPSSWETPPCEEDWDNELEGSSNSLYVWGQNNTVARKSSSVTRSAVIGPSLLERKSNLSPGIRAPRSAPCVLPWKTGATLINE
ncbi:gametocyte-specific factor 1 isoform X2 [Protopterus annectens]|nr:gametocyte-specific factor 1 isoform X2 [Protopterus annectens]XP_043939907.1 gametocyte-specific factor 1 isoform X2 [Protopterus annectens]